MRSLRCAAWDIRWTIRSLSAPWMSSRSWGSRKTTLSACSPACLRCGIRLTRCLRLGEAGVPATDPRLVKCADWILQKQVRKPGDWKVKNPKGEPGGWYFEFNNEFYPDVDDSAMVLSGAEPGGASERALSARVGAAGDRLDAVDAVQERRLGVVRQGQRPHGVPVRALCRSQRDAGSRDGRYHGTDSGVSCDLWLRPESSGGETGNQVYS